MSTRFTQTSKWEDVWFRSLAAAHKLAFLYIIDRCNNAGFWEIDLEAMAWHTKLSIEECEGAMKALERGLVGADGWIWVRTFLKHQKNDSLNPANPAHKQIIALIKDQLDRFPDAAELLPPEAALKGLQSPIGKGIGQCNGKEVGNGEASQTKPSMLDFPPALDQVLAFAKECAIGQDCAEKWFWSHDSEGWRDRFGKPIANWRSSLRGYWKTWAENNRKPGASNPTTVTPWPGNNKLNALPKGYIMLDAHGNIPRNATA